MRTSFAVVVWLVLCASLALVWGSGASRYPYGNPPDDLPMFYVGAALFVVAGLGALVIRATGEPRKESHWPGVVFLFVTALAAMAAGAVLNAMN